MTTFRACSANSQVHNTADMAGTLRSISGNEAAVLSHVVGKHETPGSAGNGELLKGGVNRERSKMFRGLPGRIPLKMVL